MTVTWPSPPTAVPIVGAPGTVGVGGGGGGGVTGVKVTVALPAIATPLRKAVMVADPSVLGEVNVAV